MPDETYPAPPRPTLADFDPESATTDALVAMVRSHRESEDYPTAEVLLANLPVVLRALCDHRLSGEAIALEVAYRLASLIEIVFTQMTKAGVFAGGAGGDDVTDFDLVVGDHDPVDQQFDERAFLLERGVGQAGFHPLAKCGDRGGQSGQFGLVIDLGIELLGLGGQGLDLLVELLSPARVLGQGDHGAQIGLGQPLDLPFQVDLAPAQRLPAGLQLLGQPVSPMGALQRVGDALGMGEQRAQIRPDQRVQGLGRDITRRAALVAQGPLGLGFGSTNVVCIIRRQPPAPTAVQTSATTDQGPQPIVVRAIVATGK